MSQPSSDRPTDALREVIDGAVVVDGGGLFDLECVAADESDLRDPSAALRRSGAVLAAQPHPGYPVRKRPERRPHDGFRAGRRGLLTRRHGVDVDAHAENLRLTSTSSKEIKWRFHFVFY